MEGKPSDWEYDLIIVGSGNGACAFLSHYLEHAADDVHVLVLEKGQDFFFTGDITHQNEWTKSYSNGPIYKLHNARTPNGTPILSGGACTMGGGSSINYTMIHESSKWLAKHLGKNESYWDCLKKELNKRFERGPPSKVETDVTSHIINAGKCQKFDAPNPELADPFFNIPSQNDDTEKQLFLFPTQFNQFGQRTNSGVSIVNWNDPRLCLETLTEVKDLDFTQSDDGMQCVSVQVQANGKSPERRILKSGGKVILCAGAATPRMLMPHRATLNNDAIGMQVNDHIALPLGIYCLPSKLALSPKDIYGPVFATKKYETSHTEEDALIVSFDFFTGKLDKLLYLTSHLFLAFLLPNAVKRIVWECPRLFSLISHVVRILVTIINFLIGLLTPGKDLIFTTAIVKYNAAKEGQYEETKDHRITLRWFESDQDKKVARSIIEEEGLALMERLGKRPPLIVQCLYRLFTKVPYFPHQIKSYIEHYSKGSLLSQQHMAGGCLIGRALDDGEKDGTLTGKVKGSRNLYVADLSAVSLPRVSPSMTAYLVGYHVANQMYPPAQK
eukprot:scaffold136154_cov57-Attheya_sp.AAC.2